MKLTRREFLTALSAAMVTGMGYPGFLSAGAKKKVGLPDNYYDIPPFGNVSFIHFTDCHAQLSPGYYREPDMHLGTGNMYDKVPHLVGKYLLDRFNIPAKSADAYALSSLDFPELAHKYGRMGGFAYMHTLIKTLRASRPGSLLLDGGDTWQGSATSLWTKGQDMIDACLLMGVDIMTGHWEFTYGMDRVKHVIENDFKGKIDFVAQNIVDYELEDRVFPPYTIKEMNGIPVAVIGQAFPYTPIANPRYLVNKWQFGIQETILQEAIDEVRAKGAQAVVLLSHNGMDLDIKLATRVTGLDAILGGHTHDAVPIAYKAKNSSGTTLVINSGSAGKFISLLDFDVKKGRVRDFKYRLIPVFSNFIEPDKAMLDHISKVRAPYKKKLNEKLAISNDLLFRRGTFNGTFDQLICDALMETQDAEIAFSPGFRWGMSVLPGQTITYEDVMAQTAITYPTVTRNNLTGARIKEILEDLADNRFNNDPYSQQGGDMVRVGGLEYSIEPTGKMGKRIQDMQLDGKPISANKKYVVAGWASIDPNVKGSPIWKEVSTYLRDKKIVSVKKLNMPKLKNIKLKNNSGIQDS